MPIFKKTKCRMKWCYSPLRHEDGTCDKFCTYNTTYVQTNADRIRAMTDEELAYFLEHETHECPAPYYKNHFDGCLLDDTPEESVTNTECDQCWLEWLKKESE